ncbi:MAG: acyl-CoA thioesterase [Xanthomonadaceae bacterium]|nr:acyl-CoA thioesterase [Xanthomonadaceae bacterium]
MSAKNPKPGKKFEYTTVILEKHLDTFGHVNNATYLQLLEEARWDLITNNGYGLKQVKELGVGPTILNIEISFKRELLLRQKVRITTQITDYSSKIGYLKHEIWNEAGELASEANYKIALFDTHKRRIITATPEWMCAIGIEA